jgi:hypothetical protein
MVIFEILNLTYGPHNRIEEAPLPPLVNDEANTKGAAQI